MGEMTRAIDIDRYVKVLEDLLDTYDKVAELDRRMEALDSEVEQMKARIDELIGKEGE